MTSGALPSGSEYLLFVTAASGVATWWSSNFSERTRLTKTFAGTGILAIVALIAMVFSA